MKADNDKRELLKLKQGLIEQSDAIPQDGYGVNMPQTAGEKAKNWLWYHTAAIIIGAVIIALGIFIWIYFTSEKADLTVYSAGNYTIVMRRLLENNLDSYCYDINQDGKVIVSLEQAADDTALSVTELYREISDGDSDIFIGTKEKLTAIYDDIMNVENRALFADLSSLTGQSGYMLDLSSTAFGKRLQIYSTEIYIAVRAGGENEEYALEVMSNIISGKVYTELKAIPHKD